MHLLPAQSLDNQAVKIEQIERKSERVGVCLKRREMEGDSNLLGKGVGGGQGEIWEISSTSGEGEENEKGRE